MGDGSIRRFLPALDAKTNAELTQKMTKDKVYVSCQPNYTALLRAHVHVLEPVEVPGIFQTGLALNSSCLTWNKLPVPLRLILIYE